MTIAYWCVLTMILLPYLFNTIAKRGMPLNNNKNPREYLKNVEGKNKRADWAHQNTLEAIPGFAAAVIVAHLCLVEQHTLDSIAVTYIALRVAYGFFYIADKDILRSISWMMSMFCVIGLFILAGTT